MARRQEVDALVAEALAEKTVAEWDAILERHDVPHAPILQVSEVLKHPQVLAREMVIEFEHPTLGRFPALGRAIRLPDHEGEPLRPPPMLGEHNEAVLSEVLGYSRERIAKLRADGVIGGSAGDPGTSAPVEP